MRTITQEAFSDEFAIYKDLTPQKHYKTYIAMKEDAEGNPFAVVLKELHPKRVPVYQMLTIVWNPYVGNTYEVFEITHSDDQPQDRYMAVTEYIYADGCATRASCRGT